jgi:DNA-binding NtrC family response regulator
MAIMAEDDIIDVSDMPAPYNSNLGEGLGLVESQLFIIDVLKDAKKAFEKEFIQKKLVQHDNNVAQTAS